MTTDWRLIPNRYAGFCWDCEKAIAAGEGFFSRERGCLVCSSDLNEHGYCPVIVIEYRRRAEIRAKEDAEHYAKHPMPETASDVCGRCDGTGNYRFSNGDTGVCFACDGSGLPKAGA